MAVLAVEIDPVQPGHRCELDQLGRWVVELKQVRHFTGAVGSEYSVLRHADSLSCFCFSTVLLNI